MGMTFQPLSTSYRLISLVVVQFTRTYTFETGFLLSPVFILFIEYVVIFRHDIIA
jgi:hypothetical protein